MLQVVPVLQILERTKFLISYGHCKGAPARNRQGEAVSDAEPEAVYFCLVGAVRRAIRDTHNGIGIDPIMAIFHRLHVDYGSLATWNDAPERTQADVVQLLDDAIESVKHD